MEANSESFASLVENLEDQGYEIAKIPLVFQYNKRDIPNLCPVDELSKALNKYGAPEFEAVATSGQGVLETLKALSKMILADLKGRP
jgi:signal recognition particle receptor subunit beta